MPAAHVYLVRHAQSVWNAIGRWQGQADPPLSDHGREQAQVLAQHFPRETIDALYTSDLQRAMETGVPIAARYGIEPIVDPDLRELDVGDWSGKTRAEIDPEKLKLWFQGVEGWSGGETYAQHDERAGRFVRGLHELDGGTVVAVTHGGTLRALVFALLELDPKERWRFSGIRHTAVTHIAMGPNGYQMVSYNSLALPTIV